MWEDERWWKQSQVGNGVFNCLASSLAPAFSQVKWEQWLCPKAVIQPKGEQVKTWRELSLRLVMCLPTGSREPSVPGLPRVSSALLGHKG